MPHPTPTGSPTADLPIGHAARETGVKVPTIRYYESIGLLFTPPRSEGGRRLYSPVDVRRLRFVRHARDLGFEVADIRTLLDLADTPERPCEHADLIARRHLDDVNDKIARLTSLRGELVRMIDNCSHGRAADCRVLETLADHGQCEAAH